ncbi:MAG TPA: hypothetical protein VM599_01435 [Thermoanaerobaculia bacterium]|nr:hypothetical protein [Thermoanaerobaculia bacterium]
MTVEAEASAASRASGAGTIGDDGDKAHLNLDARSGEAGASGRLSYRAGDLRLKGTVESLAFPTAAEARVAGSCELADGTPCRFEAKAADGGVPGAGRDRFEIRITDAAGNLLHEAGGPLETGNLRIE